MSKTLTKEDICNIIINLLFKNNITKFNFKGTKSKFKLNVYYGDEK